MEQSRVDFLYLNEKDMIEAGVLNMHACIKEMEAVFRLLSSGDYVMGGANDNSHGMLIDFPANPAHEGMPKDGPDRRFMAMPAYLGGDYKVSGCKWYGSNIANVDKGLPRSILMMTLNDADTGVPLAYQSANLLSAWRTGAIPGVGAKYLANPDSEIFGVVGAGSIGTSSAEAILDVCENIKTIKIFDAHESTAQALKDRLSKKFSSLNIEITNTLEDTIKESDVINLATAGDANPKIEKEWVKPGALFTVSSSGDFDPKFAIDDMKLIVDNWAMYEATIDEDHYPYYNPTMGVIGRQLLDWIEEEKMDSSIITDIGDIITGKVGGRTSKDDIILYGLGGQPVYDVAWGYRIYQNALKKGIGTKLNLWDEAYQAR
ncbi:tyramine oxidase subunit B [Salinicoccus siamensis]|uniref:Tyramine oxidase subunit B n=1 Tax=Salinicoccus siamensis TaxID=381830 RepID=A0ABV5Z329_9STAP